MRLDLSDSSSVIAHPGCIEESEEDTKFLEDEACMLFKHCQWVACFHPGIDSDILRTKKYKFNSK